MTDLITRIEGEGRGERALDGEIWCAAYGFEFVMWDGAGVVYRDPKAPAWDRGIKHKGTEHILYLTASLDAAIALTERLLPGQEIEMAITPSGTKCTVFIETSPGTAWLGYKGGNISPARALCAALLRALKAKETSDAS